MIDDLDAQLRPVVEAEGLELFDVVLRSGVLVVTVDREGGVDLDALTTANRALSSALDRIDPVPGRYTLEVTSPGVERPLRTPVHFTRAVGEQVTVKTRPEVPGDRRLTGLLAAATETGIELVPEDGVPVSLAYGDIDRARTVFTWGSERPSGGKSRRVPGTAGRPETSGTSGKSGKSGKKGGARPATAGAGRGSHDRRREDDAQERKQVATP